MLKRHFPKNPRHDDISVVEFPKSGVTWLSFLLAAIEIRLAGLQEQVTYYNHHRYVVDIHQIRGSRIHWFLNRTFIKSHSEFNPNYYFAIYLVRNPFDVMVSYYNFMLSHGYGNSFDLFVKDRK
jgi:hypothetical protein